jgi:hypothetical protein
VTDSIVGESELTTGLRRFKPYSEYKDSGVTWLGEVPAKWGLRRVRFVASVNPSRTELKGAPAADVSFVPMEAIGEWGGLDLTATKQLAEVANGYTYFREGDVLVAKITPCFENGKSAFARGLLNGIGFGTTELHVLRPSSKLDGRQTVTRPYLRVANVQDGYLDLSTITEVDVTAEEAHRYELRRGDVLMTEGGDFDKLGRGYVWRGQIPGCLHQNHIFAVRPKQPRLKSQYLALLTTSAYGKAYFTSTSQQTTNLATTDRRKVRGFTVPVPPPAEQSTIDGWLDEENGKIDTLIAKIRDGIQRLREYRTALISAAVTGKIDVRAEG